MSMASSDDGRGHILLEPYCILCRNHAQFARETVTGPENPKTPEPWEKTVMCFFSTASVCAGSRHHIFRLATDTERADDSDDNMYDGGPVHIDDEAIRAALDKSKMMLCYGCSDYCNLENTANVVHIPCLQVAKSVLGRLSVRELCDVAWILRPALAWYDAGEVIARQSRIAQLLLPGGGHPHQSTELGSLVRAVRERLPLDVERLICDEIPAAGLFASLSSCMRTLCTLEDNGWLEKGVHARKPLLSLMPFQEASYSSLQAIRCDTVNILGEECLVRVAPDDNDDHGSRYLIQLLDKPISGVQWALGTYGVRALRICYTDGSFSAWLGNVPHKWIRFVRGSNLSKLEARSDGHKLLSLKFEASETRDDVDGVFWEHAPTPDVEQTASIIDFAQRTAVVRGSPRSRLVRNIALPVADGRPHAITLFCSSSGVDCIQVDGDCSLREAGSPRWCSVPVTSYLQPDEVVDTIYSILRESGMDGILTCPAPYLLMRTSLGRWLHFGLFVRNPATLTFMQTVMSYGSEATHHPTGLFFDALNSHINLGFYKTCNTSMGVVQEPRRSSGDASAPPPADTAMPRLQYLDRSDDSDDSSGILPYNFLQGTFLTKTALSGVQQIMQQRDGDRVRGLFAQFSNDTIRILGSWRPAKMRDASVTTTIFSADTDAGLESLTFLMSFASPQSPEPDSFVKDVIINSGDGMDQPHFRWDRLDEEVAWFFCHYGDSVRYWKGTEYEPKIDYPEQLGDLYTKIE